MEQCYFSLGNKKEIQLGSYLPPKTKDIFEPTHIFGDCKSVPIMNGKQVALVNGLPLFIDVSDIGGEELYYLKKVIAKFGNISPDDEEGQKILKKHKNKIEIYIQTQR